MKLVVIGGGEHARVVIETARTRGDLWTVEGFADPLPCEETQRRLAVAWLGDDASATRTGCVYVLGVGEIGVGTKRRTIAARYAGAPFAAVVHASAIVSPTATIGDGAVILAGAIVQTGAQIGIHAVVGTGAIVEHDVAIGAYTQLGPGVVIGGGAAIGDDCYLGLGCRIRDHVAIGNRTMIAMGAVVTTNVGDGSVMAGVPARRR